MQDEIGKTCGLCGHDSPNLSQIAEDYVLDLIRRDHPEWVRENGACPECLAYYSSLEDVIQVVGKEKNE